MPQYSILGPLLFLLHINDLPNAIDLKAIPILFADETSILIKSPNNIQFQSDLNIFFGQLYKWFKTNLLSLNFDKTYSFSSLIKAHVPLTYKLHMKINKFLQLLKENFWGYLLIIHLLGKHTLNVQGGSNMTGTDFFFFCNHNWHLLAHVSLQHTPLTRAGGRVEVVASLSQGRTASAQCGLFTHKSVPVIFEPPCIMSKLSSAYYAMQSVKLHVSLNTLKMTLRCRHHPQHYANTTTPK